MNTTPFINDIQAFFQELRAGRISAVAANGELALRMGLL
jgi:hypothetical protein